MNEQVNRAEATASTEAQNADAASVVPTPTAEDGGSGSTPCSFSAIDSWDGLITMDMFSDRPDFGSYIHVTDVGMLFIQYLEDSGEILQRCLEKADKEGQILAGDVCQYKPAMKFFGRTST
jgi:hypothetical protein